MTIAKSSVPGIPVFNILQPRLIPDGRLVFQGIEPQARIGVLAISGEHNPEFSNTETLSRVRKALKLFPGKLVSAEAGSSETDTADGTTHDAYCHIERVAGDPPQIFIFSILQAYRRLLEESLESGTSLEGNDCLRLSYAFESILHYVLWQPLAIQRPLPLQPPANYEHRDPMRRWIIGHHLFAALTQGLILIFNDLKTALACDRNRDAALAFELSIILMEGSALAFRFATDFSSEEYQNVVRPTMMPPNAPRGLSGVMSMDHRYLINILADLKPYFQVLSPTLRMHYERFRCAFQTIYESHKFVCERFTGREQPSLLMKSNPKKSAADELELFKRSRMKMLPIIRADHSEETSC